MAVLPSDVAISLAEAGIFVFPCHPGGEEVKRPMPGVFWRNQSTTDAARIDAWWRRWPDAVVGIDLAKSGLLVIDADRKPDRPDGVAAFIALGFDLSGVPQVQTPSDGVHYYFRQGFNPPHGNARGILPAGIDVRGHGGYVIAPGCEIEAGSYIPLNDVAEPAPVPPWLAGLLRPLTPRQSPHSPQIVPNGSPYAEEALRRECEIIASAASGTRNETINTSAFNVGQLVPHLIPEGEALGALNAAASALGLKPNDKAFGPRGTIMRGLRAGMECPREPERHARTLVEVDGLLADAETGEILEEPEIPSGDLPSGVLNVPGLLGDIVQWIVASSQKPQPALALGAAVTVLGTAMGRQIAGPTDSGTALYVVGLAKTGYGKDGPKSAIPTLLRSARMLGHLGPDEFISMPAVINFIQRSPLSLCAMDEFGAFLKRINNRRASGFEGAISKILRSAWTSDFKVMMTPEWAGKASTPIVGPCMSIYGVSTPAEFYAALAGGDVSNGFLNRFLVVEARTKPGVRRRTADPTEVPAGICDGIRDIYLRKGDMFAVGLNRSDEGPAHDRVSWDTPAVERLHEDHVRACEEEIDQHPERESFLARTAEMAVRLATIRAVGCDAAYPVVRSEDLDWGIQFARYSAATMMAGVMENMAESDDQAHYKLVLSIVREAKGGRLTRTDLYRKVDGRIDKRKMDSAIAMLVEGGRMEEVRVRKDGTAKPTTMYVLRN